MSNQQEAIEANWHAIVKDSQEIEKLKRQLNDLSLHTTKLAEALQSVANGPKPTTPETQEVWINVVRQLAKEALAAWDTTSPKASKCEEAGQ